MVKLGTAVQKAYDSTPMFHDCNMLLERDNMINRHARKLALGTRGNVGSMEFLSAESEQELLVRKMPVLYTLSRHTLTVAKTTNC